MTTMNDDNHDGPALHPIENESIESWTLVDESDTIHQGSRVDNIVDKYDDDTKLTWKSSRNSCISENSLSASNHGIDSDISDEISVMSDSDNSIDRDSPMTSQNPCEEKDRKSSAISQAWNTALLAEKMEDLTNESLALKVEVKRLVELHHADHERERQVRERSPSHGAVETPVHTPMDPVTHYCKDQHSDYLSTSYDFKKCDNIDDSKIGEDQKVKSKNASDDDQIITTDNSAQQFNKDDKSSIESEIFGEVEIKNTEHRRATSGTDEYIRKDIDEVIQKYFERTVVLEESKNNLQQSTDDKMMEHTKQQNRENWYMNLANGSLDITTILFCLVLINVIIMSAFVTLLLCDKVPMLVFTIQ